MKRGPVDLVKQMAEEELPYVMKRLGIPDTETNRADIIALALNSLPPKYVTTSKGKQFAQLSKVYEAQFELDITAALAKAGLKVLERPGPANDGGKT